MKNILILLVSLFVVSTVFAQDYEERLREKLEKKIEDKVDEGIDKTLEGKEDEPEKESPKEKKKSSEASGAKEVTKAPAQEEFKSFSKFDFVSGDRVIFFDDFAQDNIGDFPVKWNTNGKGEVVTSNLYPGKWLKMREATTYLPEISSAKFPENYTIEYDMVVTGEDRYGSFIFELTSLPNKQQVPNASDPSGPGLFLTADLVAGGKIRYQVKTTLGDGSDGGATTDIEDATLNGKPDEKFHVSIAVNKQRFRYYVNEVKVLDLPRVMPNINYNAFIFRIWSWGLDHPSDALISNIRYAEGITDVRSKLMTEGKLVTHGILFDVNSDKIKPESFGTLKEIAAVLKENASVRVTIVGHTDGDGDAKKNLDLSKRRAESVKNSLAKDFGIDAGRMQTDGKGASVPASPNTTAEGKANNRRVEFIKL